MDITQPIKPPEQRRKRRRGGFLLRFFGFLFAAGMLFIAAGDKNFYQHGALDIQGILRAAVTNLSSMQSGRRMVGASTITQQVAKNFLLTNEVAAERTLKKAVLDI